MWMLWHADHPPKVCADWKLDRVIPICKNSMRADPGNHRSVNLTSVPRKITVKIYTDNKEKGQSN